MTDSKHLRSESANLHRKMQAKLSDADKANLRAENLGKVNDFTRASYERDRANKYYKEALQMEHDAIALETKASLMEAKITEIEQIEQQLKAKYQEDIDKLEKQKDTLRG